jgi:cytochrome P450
MTDMLSVHSGEGEPGSVADGYDIFGAGYRQDPTETWRTVRSGSCPVAHTDQWGGSYMLARYDDIRDAARDAGRFSSRAVEVAGPLEAAGGLYLPPLTSDPPDHKPHRDVLMPFFMPKQTATYEDFIRAEARGLAEQIAAAGAGDAVSGYAEHLTLAVLTRLLGVPPGGRFTEWMVRMIRVGPRDQAVRAEAVREILAYLEAQLADRAGHPTGGDDLLSYLVDAEIDGVALSRKHKLGAAFLVLIAGADTTWSAIGASIWHLATHDEDRSRILADPKLLDTAAEELLRAYAPVTVGRIVTSDTEVHGCPVAQGQRVVLPFGAANRDPEVFENPDEVVIDRRRNRHLTFGSGAHRCLGSNLARLELRIALEEWLRAIPRFRLTDPDAIEWSGGQTRGPERVDIQVEPRGAAR